MKENQIFQVILALTKTEYIILAIVIIVVLIGIFFITYVINKRTPVPKGCENLIDTEKCLGCSNTLCKHNPEKKEEEGSK